MSDGINNTWRVAGPGGTSRDNDISMCEHLGSARGQHFMSDDDAINYPRSADITHAEDGRNTTFVSVEHFINTDIIMQRINIGSTFN